jgi:hypothetical protein
MTDAELRDKAVAALQATTISYPEWYRRKTTGKYPDITKTKWWQAFDYLERIGAEPPVTGPVPPVGPFTTRSSSLMMRDGDGATTKQVHVTRSSDYGIGNMRWPYAGPSSGVWNLTDCRVENVSADPPRSMDGTGEAGFWVGETTNAARLEATKCAWMGMWTGAAVAGSRFVDVNLHDNPLIQLYCEHVTRDVTFTNCSFGPGNTGSSINVEWWYADPVYGPTLPYGGKAGSFDVTFVDCDIWCPAAPADAGWRAYQYAGAFLDAGTFGFTFKNCRFWGPGKSVGLPRNTVDPAKPNLIVECVFENAGGGPYTHDNLIG